MLKCASAESVECIALVGLSYKAYAAPVPQKLLKSLLSEEVELKDVMLLKDTMNKWITIVSEKAEI